MKYIILILCIVLLVACEEDVSVTQVVDYQPANTKVFVYSNPSNAKIYINGRYTGFNTPDTLTYLQNHQYFFSLKLKYYADYNFQFTPKKNDSRTIDLNFFNMPNVQGSLNIKSFPSKCKVRIDNQVIAENTPSTISMNPGEYKLYFEADNCWQDSADVEIYSGRTSVVSKSLVDSSNFVIYNEKNIGLPNDNSRLVAVDKHGKIWCVTNSHTIFTIDRSKVISFNITNFGFNGYISEIQFDDNNDLWIGTALGILKYDGTTIQDYSAGDSAGKKFINDIFIDDKNQVWLASNEGIGKVEGAAVNWDNQPVELKNQPIYSLYIDDDYSYFGGKNLLFKWDKSITLKEFYISDSDKGHHPKVLRISKGVNGLIWVASEKLHGNLGLPPKLYILDNELDEIRTTNENFTSIHNYKNYTIMADRHDLYFYQGKTLANKLFMPYYVTQDYELAIFDIYYDKINKAIWMGTNRGLIKIKDHYLEGIL